MKNAYVEPHTRRCRHTLDFFEESLTLQAHKDECDVNKIVARFDATRQLPANMREGGSYMDVSDVQQLDLAERIRVSRTVEAGLKAYAKSQATKQPGHEGAPGGAAAPASSKTTDQPPAASASAPAGGPTTAPATS